MRSTILDSSANFPDDVAIIHSSDTNNSDLDDPWHVIEPIDALLKPFGLEIEWCEGFEEEVVVLRIVKSPNRPSTMLLEGSTNPV